tara:strand:+ start:555 stop:3449 length:2895 start_codon:yes stop_codon:yes gene_type:complete
MGVDWSALATSFLKDTAGYVNEDKDRAIKYREELKEKAAAGRKIVIQREAAAKNLLQLTKLAEGLGATPGMISSALSTGAEGIVQLTTKLQSYKSKYESEGKTWSPQDAQIRIELDDVYSQMGDAPTGGWKPLIDSYYGLGSTGIGDYEAADQGWFAKALGINAKDYIRQDLDAQKGYGGLSTYDLSQMEGTSTYDTGETPIGAITYQDTPIFGFTNQNKFSTEIRKSFSEMNADKTGGSVYDLNNRINDINGGREGQDLTDIVRLSEQAKKNDPSLDQAEYSARLKRLKIVELKAAIEEKKRQILGGPISRYLGTFDWETMFGGADNALKNDINNLANDPTFVDSFRDGVSSTSVPVNKTGGSDTGGSDDGEIIDLRDGIIDPDRPILRPVVSDGLPTVVDLDGLDIADLGATNFSGYGLPSTFKYLYDAEDGTVKDGVSITKIPGSNKVTIKFNNNSETGNSGLPDGEPVTYEITYQNDDQSTITGLSVNGTGVASNQFNNALSMLQQFKDPESDTILTPPAATGVSFDEADVNGAVAVLGSDLDKYKTDGVFDPEKIKKVIYPWAKNAGNTPTLKAALGKATGFGGNEPNVPAFINKIIESLGGTVDVSSNNANGEVQLASSKVSESLRNKLKNLFSLKAEASTNSNLKAELEAAGVRFDTSMDESATSVAGEKQRLDTEELIAAVKAGEFEKANLLALQIEESRDEERAFVAPPSSTVTEEPSFSGSSAADNPFITEATRARMAREALAKEVVPTIDDDLRRDIAREPAELANLLAAVRAGDLEEANLLAQQIEESRDEERTFTAPPKGESPVSSTMGPVSVDTTTPNISQTGLASGPPSVNISEDTLPQFTDAPGLGARRINVDASPLNTERPVSPRIEKFVQVIAETIKPKSTLGRAQRDNKLKVNNSQLRTLIEKQLQKDGVLPSPYSSSMKPKERKLIIDQHAEAYIASRVEEVAN